MTSPDFLHPTLWLRLQAAFLLTLLVTACSEATSKDGEKKAAANTPAKLNPAEAAAARMLADSVEEVTGDHTRAVWTKTLSEGGSDTYVNGTSHVLMGFDSQDGLGVRTLLGEKDNYARPLLSPDGQHVVFTNKNTERDEKKRKHYSPVVWSLPFGSADAPRELAAGYASDIWRDPDTGTDWVYVVRDFTASSQGAMEGKQLVRFQLHDPEVEEMVWNGTLLSPDNIQLSRDGTRASCQFPWPTCGYLDLAEDGWEKLAHGCWPSYAPDDSHLAWVFDGAHRKVTLFSTRTGATWKIDLTTAPGTDGKELYHPRWTNHPRLITLTGPYRGVKGREIQVTKGGQHAEIYIGRLSASLDSVEAWAQVTVDSQGDFYPDVWIAGGHQADLDPAEIPQLAEASAGPAQADTSSSTWPIASDKPLLLWKDRASKNEIPTPEADQRRARQCSLELHGLARFNRSFGIDLDGGRAEPDPASREAIEAALIGDGIGLEILLTPGEERRQGNCLLKLGRWLVLESDALLHLADLAEKRSAVLGPAKADTPMHLALQLPGKGSPVCWIDGQAHELRWKPSAAPEPASDDNLLLGGGADVAMTRVSISASSDWPAEAVRSSAKAALADAQSLTPIPRRQVRARLATTTPIPSFETIDPYTRALVTYAYEDVEVIEGPPIDSSRITVQRWGLMDKTIVPGMPGKVGDFHQLILEPLDAQPQLEGERAEDDVLDFTSPAFYLAE